MQDDTLLGTTAGANQQHPPSTPSDGRIAQLARSYADTIGRHMELNGGRFNYVNAAMQIERCIRQALDERRRLDVDGGQDKQPPAVEPSNEKE